MAFGMKTTSGDFLPICKYDARAGKFFKVDKRMDGTSEPTELPLGTKFAIDFGSFEAGYVSFGKQGPVRHMKPYIDGEAMPAQPQEKDAEGKLMFRPGFYAKICGNALDGVREWCSNAAVLLNAMDDLYQSFIRAPEAASGQIPIICIASTVAVKSGTGARTSTNYAPVLRIEGWTQRPELLGPRTVPAPAASAPAMNAQAAQAMAAKPPVTETQGWGAPSAGPVTPPVVMPF
jgi:hypothetical protein